MNFIRRHTQGLAIRHSSRYRRRRAQAWLAWYNYEFHNGFRKDFMFGPDDTSPTDRELATLHSSDLEGLLEATHSYGGLWLFLQHCRDAQVTTTTNGGAGKTLEVTDGMTTHALTMQLGLQFYWTLLKEHGLDAPPLGGAIAELAATVNPLPWRKKLVAQAVIAKIGADHDILHYLRGLAFPSQS